MATGSPRGPIYETGVTGPDFRIRIREIRIFSGIFFFTFFASTDPLGPQEHSPEVPVPPNPDPDREIRIFRNFFFAFFGFYGPFGTSGSPPGRSGIT